MAGTVERHVPVGFLPQRLDLLDDDASVFDNVSRRTPDADANSIRARLARFLFRGAAGDRLVGRPLRRGAGARDPRLRAAGRSGAAAPAARRADQQPRLRLLRRVGLGCCRLPRSAWSWPATTRGSSTTSASIVWLRCRVALADEKYVVLTVADATTRARLVPLSDGRLGVCPDDGHRRGRAGGHPPPGVAGSPAVGGTATAVRSGRAYEETRAKVRRKYGWRGRLSSTDAVLIVRLE